MSNADSHYTPPPKFVFSTIAVIAVPCLSTRYRKLARALLLATLCLAAANGCVRRRLTVRSNPPGAAVYVDNQQIGTTPVSTGFTYYGTRSVTLVKDGYETQTVQHNIDAPWYQVPPLDFFSDNFSVREIRDERVLDFTLVPQQMMPAEDIYRNAENLRQSAQQGYVIPLPEGGGVGTSPTLPAPTSPFPGGAEGIPVPPPIEPSPYPMGSIGTRGPWR